MEAQSAHLSAPHPARWAIIAVFALVALMVTHPQTYDPDIYWHIRSGQVVMETGDVIRGDVFSYTLPGEIRVHPDWLAEVILASFYNVMGTYGLTLLGGLLSFISIVLMYRLMRGLFGIRVIFMMLAATATMSASMARPQAWMIIFNLIVLAMVLRRKPSLRWLPILMMFWSNLHGGWTIGYIILGASVVTETARIVLKRGGDVVWLRQLILWSFVAAPALMINPYGFDILLVPLDTVAQSALAYIVEWRPPNLLDADRIGFVIFFALSWVVLIKQRHKIGLLEAVLLIGFGLWSLRVARIITVYMFIAPVILAPHLSDILKNLSPSPLRLKPVHWALMGVLAVAVVFRFATENSPNGMRALTAQKMPVSAVEYLLENRPARQIFNEYNWGGYLILYAPDYPVFMDGRGDLYEAFFTTYFDVVNLKDGWRETLDQWGVQTVLVYTEGALGKALLKEPGWTLAYADSLASLYIRTLLP